MSYLLNSKPIMDCKNEMEEEQHAKEIEKAMELVSTIPNYKCGVRYVNFDIANKDKDCVIRECYLHDCFKMPEYVDIKNGVDLCYVNGCLTFMAHGQGYEHHGAYHLKETGIQIIPYDRNRNFVCIFNECKELYHIKDEKHQPSLSEIAKKITNLKNVPLDFSNEKSRDKGIEK